MGSIAIVAIERRRLSIVATLLLTLATFGCTASGSPTNDLGSDDDVTIVNLNVLHGLFCGGEACRLTDRISLLFGLLEQAKCPDVVTLQEVSSAVETELQQRVASLCDGAYQLGFEKVNGLDDAVILSRYAQLTLQALPLFGGFRHALRAEIDHPAGPLLIFTTHLASGSDGANDPCGDQCPSECTAAGAKTKRQCQAVQLGELVSADRAPDALTLITGDFNASPTDPEYLGLKALGWIDTYAEAGNPECNASGGEGCTSGRESDLTALESTDSGLVERIDFVFSLPPTNSQGSCAGTIEAAGDPDDDGQRTGPFAHQPNPLAASCGPTPEAICWPSDHSGVQADLGCAK